MIQSIYSIRLRKIKYYHIELIFLIVLYAFAAQYYLLHNGFPWGFSRAQIDRNYTHLLHTSLLKNHLASSLWHLHAQPPLYNALFGVFLKLFDEYRNPFWVFYFICSIITLVCLYASLLKLKTSRFARLAPLTLLLVSPTLYVYQSRIFTTHIEVTLYTIIFLCIVTICTHEKQKKYTLHALFIAFCLLGMIKPMHHICIPITVWGFLYYRAHKKEKHQVRLAILWIIPLICLYTKNYMMFGFWGSSSWFGGNIATVTQHLATEDTLKTLKNEGTISHYFPITFDKRKIVEFNNERKTPNLKYPH